jgi:hypothetical protein
MWSLINNGTVATAAPPSFIIRMPPIRNASAVTPVILSISIKVLRIGKRIENQERRIKLWNIVPVHPVNMK